MAASIPFYSKEELLALGATQVDDSAQVSRLVQFYGFKGSIGAHARIDDFAILKGRVDLGAYVHISAYCLVSGVGGTITFKDFSGIAAYTALYTASDDYKGPYLSNPTVPPEHTNVFKGNITLGEGALVGAHCVILPKAVLGDYATVGALCIVTGKKEEGELVLTGGPARSVGKRDAETLATLRKRAAEVRKKR